MTKKILIVISFAILVLPLAATAQGTVAVNTAAGAGVASAVKGVLARCPIVESKIQVKAVNFDNNKIRHLEAYAKVKERVLVLIGKLEAKGIDVTNLKADLVVFDQKVTKFSDDYVIYIGKLKESQVYVCGKSEGQFLAKLKEVKVALAQVHQDAVNIRTYYAQVLKPEINRIKATFRIQKASSTPDVNLETPATTEFEAEQLVEPIVN